MIAAWYRRRALRRRLAACIGKPVLLVESPPAVAGRACGAATRLGPAQPELVRRLLDSAVVLEGPGGRTRALPLDAIADFSHGPGVGLLFDRERARWAEVVAGAERMEARDEHQ